MQKKTYRNNVYTYYQVGNKFDIKDNLNRLKINVLSFSHICSQTKDINTTHSHGFLEIFIFDQGEGILEVSNQNIKIKGGQLLILDSNIEHKQYSISKENQLKYYNYLIDDLSIAGYKANSLAYMIDGNNSLGFYIKNLEKDSSLKDYISLIISELEAKEGAYQIKVKALFDMIFIDIIRQLPLKNFSIKTPQKDTEIKRVMKEIREYIEENYMENITLQDLSKRIFLSKSRMLHLFKNFFAISPMQYLTFIRLGKAKNLLTETQKNITEIANLVGYNNSAYFSEVFIRYTSVTPSVYRKITTKDLED